MLLIAGKMRRSTRPIEVELAVAGALELLEDDLVHARAGVDQRRWR